MKYVYKLLLTLILFTLIISIGDFTIIANAEFSEVALRINGENIISDSPPLLSSGSTIAPVRIVSEKLGAFVGWNGETRAVTIDNKGEIVKLQIDSKTVVRGSETFSLSIAPQIIDGRTYVPLRFVSEVLGYIVNWDNANKMVIIDNPQFEEPNDPVVPGEPSNPDVPDEQTNPNDKTPFISDILRVRLNDNTLAVFVDIKGEYKYNTTLLSNPERLVVDFPNTKFDLDKSRLDSNGVFTLPMNGQYINRVRASQHTVDAGYANIKPWTSRIVLDLSDKNGYVEIEKRDGYLAIYYTGTTGNTVNPSNPVDPDLPNPPNGNNDLPMGITGHTLKINTLVDKEVKVEGFLDEQQTSIYGYINGSVVNLRTGPSTESEVTRTLPRGTKLQVVGQTTGWYQVVYSNSVYWVSDEYFAVELKMLRNNVNVRSGPGLSFSVIDNIPRGTIIKVLSRHPDWYKVETPSGKTGYIADYLIGLNERLIETATQNEVIAKDLVLTFKNTHSSDIELTSIPDIVIDHSVESDGSDTKVHLSFSYPIAYRYSKVDGGFQVDLGSVLKDMVVTENDNRVIVDMYFDAPTRFVINQNLAMHNMMLEFMYTKTANEQIYNVDSEIVKTVETINTSDSFQVKTLIGDIGTYKLNTTGYSDHVKLEFVSSSLNGKIIAIDPGHGGSDPGPIHAGIKESDVVLAVSLKVRDLLLDRGVTVVMTRDTDRHVYLDDRISFVNQMNADIAVSIHANSVTNRSVTGVETIYYPRAESERLARAMQNGLVAATGFTNRGIKSRPEIRFTREVNMPSALLEIGFLSNASDRAYITSQTGQNRIAEQIVAAIERFFLYQ